MSLKTGYTFDLKKINEIFDGNKKLVKETIQVFIKHKVNELKELEDYISVEKDCKKIQKVVHKMQSGFRVFDMQRQEQAAGTIEKLAMQCSRNKETELVIDNHFNQLKSDTHSVIELLEKELLKF